MKNKKLLCALIISLVFNVAFLGTLGYRMLKRHQYRSHRHSRFDKSAYYEKMNLTTEQREHLDSVRMAFYPRMRSLHSALMKKRRAFAQILIEGELDSTEIENHLHLISKLQYNVEREVSHQLLREKEILTQEARKYYLKSIERYMSRRYGRSSDNYRRSGGYERRSDKSYYHGGADKDTSNTRNR